MASKLFIIAVLSSSLTIFLSILALSLNYWQGRTLQLKEIFDEEMLSKMGQGKGGNGGLSETGPFAENEDDDSGRWSVPFKSAGNFRLQTSTIGSIADMGKMKDMIMSEKPTSGLDLALNTVMNIHGGIWHICIEIVEFPDLPGLALPEFCIYLQKIDIPYFYLPSNKEWTQADWTVPRGMLFIGMFCMVTCLISVLVKWVMMPDKSVLLSLGAASSLVAGIFFVAGFSIFADTMKLEFLDYQSAFYFCVLSWLLAWVTGGVLVFARVSNKDLDIA